MPARYREYIRYCKGNEEYLRFSSGIRQNSDPSGRESRFAQFAWGESEALAASATLPE